MTGTMICTRCFRDTHIAPPETGEFDVSMIKTLCESWLCDDCLDLAEAELTIPLEEAIPDA